MSPANPLSRLSAIIRGPISTHSSGSDWFLPYDGPVEPPPAPPIRHPFAAAEIAQPRPVKVQPESRSRANSKSDDVRSRSRSRSVDTKRKSQRSFATLEKGGVGAYPDGEREYDHAHSGHVRGKSSIARDPKQSFPWSDDSLPTGDTPALVFANHPFRMHTTSPPPRTHTASTPLTTATTPWVRTITASPAPPDPAPMRKRTMTYQPGLVTTFGSSTESRVGYRESGAFVDLDERERERIRPTLLPSSLSLLAKGASDLTLPDELGRKKSPAKDRELYPGLKQTYDLRSHPYALQSAPMRETRFGSVSTTGTTTTGGSGSVKPPVPPRSRGTKLKSSLKASMSTPELRIHIPSNIPPSGLSAGQTPSTADHPQSQLGLGARPRHLASSVAASAARSTLEARSICDALIFARPRFRVASREITPPATPHDDDAAKRASIRVGEGGLKGLVCFPRKASRDFSKDKGKNKEKEKEKEKEPREFQTLEQVLKQGAQLEKERQEWNAIGQGSLFNSRARSLSRSQHRNAPRNGKRSVSVSDSNGPKVWGTIKIKRSVEMLAASALSQGHGPAPSVTSSKRTGGHGTQPSVSTASHARHPSGSVTSRAHSRNESWGQRVVCGSRSGSSLGDETPGQHHHSSEGSLPKRAPVDNYPVVDIRPVPVGNANRARAPPSVGFSFGSSPSKIPKQPSPGPGDSESVIGLALSSPSGTSTPLMLPNHPFAHRAGAYPTDPTLPPPPVPETIATRHRHPPRSSGSTERARLDDIPKSAPPAPTKFGQHPFVARASTHSGEEVQHMFESAMLRSAGGQGDFGFHARRGSGDSGLGSSVHELAGHLPLLSSSAPVRGSAFGPPAGLEAMLERAPVANPIPTPIPESSASPPSSSQSPPSLMDSLSPTSRMMTRTSSGMIDPSLMSPQSRSHESTSSSFSSPRPLNSIDDIESLRDIFYRPSPDRRAGSLAYHSQDGSPASEPVLVEEEEEEEEEEEDGGRNDDWTFGRRPFELGPDAHLIWRRQREDDVDGPLRISLAPGTPSPPPLEADDRSERSVRTTTSQQVSGENVTFGVVPSARMDMLSVNVVSPRQSAALSLIDMYDYEFSLPNTPQHTQSHPSSYHTLSSPGSATLPMDATATPLSASVLSSYFTVDTSSRRETD
ncbi:Serine/arginine repetitive matrix protein 2 [Rhizoctonia solani]|uniref:Serine/arginine repetitive matrix protein 2 n=1 Tax=Rhizoctonia solani TaxID=456999 RepID=A0A0K6GGF7_9AGAM|nr:Serine/arginine repetitive matrix protein 2 [Rhizoctonia solani]